MKKVTIATTSAFIAGNPLKMSNTEVKVYEMGEKQIVELRLFGNLIATREIGARGFDITNAGWTSVTTKERLNGLPYVSISQKKAFGISMALYGMVN